MGHMHAVTPRTAYDNFCAAYLQRSRPPDGRERSGSLSARAAVGRHSARGGPCERGPRAAEAVARVHARAGMDFYVVLDRAGYRVAKRRQQLSRVGVQHKVTKEDAIKWFQTKFEGVVLNKQHQY
jgi:hypothetical protein